MPFNIGSTELIVLLLVLVLLFGATRLPKAAEGIGKSLKVFKREIKTESDDADEARPVAQESQTKQQTDQRLDVQADSTSTSAAENTSPTHQQHK